MPTLTIQISQQQLRELLSNDTLVVSVQTEGMPMGPASHKRDGSQTRADATTFWDVFEQQIEKQRRGGSLRTTETYQAAHRKFWQFMEGRPLLPCEMTSDLMESYQAYMRSHDLSLNTVSFHFRILRAVYHKAVDMGLTADCRPFRKVYTGIPRTSKRALTLPEIKRIKELTLGEPQLRFSRDLFLFSIYTRGMSFVDMVYLRKDDIKNGVLTYKRHKTGQMLSISWEACMREIASRYSRKDSPYLLPSILKENGKERNQYRHVQWKVNKALKVIACRARVDRQLTMYCARHSWATIARQLNVPIEVISKGMGHTNERTTEVYLKSIDIQTVDRVNRLIINTI